MVTQEELKELIGNSSFTMYQKLNSYILEHYQMELSWSKGGKYGTHCLRYQKSKKTLCTIYFRQNQIGIWVILGAKEREKYEASQDNFSAKIKEIYNKTQNYHDGKWLAFDVTDDTLLEDIQKLLAIKRKPK